MDYFFPIFTINTLSIRDKVKHWLV